MQIDHYRFGHIDIEGRSYDADVIIFPNHVQKRWWRHEGHQLATEDLGAATTENQPLATADPLGIGGLLTAAHTLAQLTLAGIPGYDGLLKTLLDEAAPGLEYYARDRDTLGMPADYRLAFRELGLSIGLRALVRTAELAAQRPGAFDSLPSLGSRLERLMRYVPLIDAVEDFWLEPRNREGTSWKEHEDINAVMLATSLAPESYLAL
jgi:hypothetical protein